MFVWTSGFQKSLAHTDFDMFVDEWTSANESPVQCLIFDEFSVGIRAILSSSYGNLISVLSYGSTIRSCG